LAVAAEFGSLQAYFRPHAQWGEAGPAAIGELAAETAASRLLSRDLKRRAFSFVGPTIVYSLMQAVGLVNDHAAGCAVRAEAEAERAAWAGRPA
jgi:DNA-3-methyladenine glycosylase I